MTLYRVHDWESRFENNRTKDLKSMSWVPVPCTHDGCGYRALMAEPDGTALFGAWNLILQVAAKCEPRGTLVRGNRLPHTARSLALATGGDEQVFGKALKLLSGSEIGWLDVADENGIPQDNAAAPQQGAAASQVARARGKENTEGKGREDSIGVPQAALKPKRGSRFVPDDFGLTEDRIRYGVERGLTEPQVRAAFEQFRLHEFATPKRDFHRAFLRWLRNIADGIFPAPAVQALAAPPTAEQAADAQQTAYRCAVKPDGRERARWSAECHEAGRCFGSRAEAQKDFDEWRDRQ